MRAVNTNHPEGLPWHVRVHDHVFIWAGGDFVRRMHFTFYVLLVHGQPVQSDLLTADDWVDREAFEQACEDYEKKQVAQLYLPPMRTLIKP